MASANTEQKEQQAIDAAETSFQNTQAGTNPDKVEQQLVDDTRKAGLPAYQFDPDASPEEKAAEAEAVRLNYLLVCPRDGSLMLIVLIARTPGLPP